METGNEEEDFLDKREVCMINYHLNCLLCTR